MKSNKFALALSMALALALALALTACVEENPTGVGDQLIPGGQVVSFEVVLPASAFLLSDTSFSGYTKASDAAFSIVARQFENVLDANALMQFLLAPAIITVRNAAGTLQADSLPRYFSGRLVLKIDTLMSKAVSPVRLRLLRTAEEWDVSATWINRIDTGTVHLPWATPGATGGVQIDTATWTAGDSIVFRVDSQSVAIWNDSTNKARGAVVVAETNGARIRVLSATARLSARSTLRPDTVVVSDVVPAKRTFIYTPTLATTGTTLRIGGTPSWRSFLNLRSDLATLTFPCPNGVTGCTVPLTSANIASAQLLLKPIKPPAGFAPEDTMFIDVRTLASSASVPIERSPVLNRIAVSNAIAPSLFTAPAANDLVRVDVTSFIAHLTDPNVKETDRLASLITLMQLAEPSTFGFAEFSAAPSLRLVLTAALERR